jgi:hypothetical protein
MILDAYDHIICHRDVIWSKDVKYKIASVSTFNLTFVFVS